MHAYKKTAVSLAAVFFCPMFDSSMGGTAGEQPPQHSLTGMSISRRSFFENSPCSSNSAGAFLFPKTKKQELKFSVWT